MVALDDFKVIGLLGRGSLGKVILVERDNVLLAMKSYRKDAIVENH